MEARVKFPTPRHLLKCQFPASRVTFSNRLERICLLQPHIVFTVTQERQCQKMSPLRDIIKVAKMAAMSNSRPFSSGLLAKPLENVKIHGTGTSWKKTAVHHPGQTFCKMFGLNNFHIAINESTAQFHRYTYQQALRLLPRENK